MFDSNVKAETLIAEILNEADIAPEISEEALISHLCALEQLVYSEIIREQGKAEVSDFSGEVVQLSEVNVPDGERNLVFENIHAVFANDTQLLKTTALCGTVFTDVYFKIAGNLGLNLKNKPSTIRIVYFVAPAIKTPENYSEYNVMIPVEFIELARAKLRAEAYKLANEDELCAKWLNDYNVLLEDFKMWIASKRPEFGM